MSLNISPVSFNSRKLPYHRTNTVKIADSASRVTNKIQQQSAEAEKQIEHKKPMKIKQLVKDFIDKYFCDDTPEKVKGEVVDLNPNIIDSCLSPRKEIK